MQANEGFEVAFHGEYLEVVPNERLVSTEFFEGVRALLIERDNEPKWNPPTRPEVSEAIVNRYFEKLPDEPDLDLKL